MPKLSDRLLLGVVPLAASLIMRFLGKTVRFTVVDRPDISEGEPAIFTFWHGRMLMMPFANSFGPFAVMVSRHKDGELISRTVKRLGIESARGSTTRGGAAGLRDIIELSRKGYNIAFTPDGPRGPRHVAQMGPVQAAKATGLAIHPVTYSTRKKKL